MSTEQCVNDPAKPCKNGKVRLDVKIFAAACVTIATIWGMFGGLALLPPRMLAVEAHNKAQDERIERLIEELREHRELLIRVDERVREMWARQNRN